MSSMAGLIGRTALVTGSGRGIGRAIALRLAYEGANICVNDLSMPDDVGDLERECKSHGVDVSLWEADVSDAEQVSRMVDHILARWGRIDILVNNAGIERDALIHKMSEEDWDTVIRVNLKSCFLCCRAVVPTMLAQSHGRIINISSRAWQGGFGQSSYSASKGGIVSLTRTLALELAAKGITSNCVAPGLIDTPLFRSFREDAKERLIGLQPCGYIGQPEDVAHAVAFFASDESSYITGQTLYVCGGKSLRSA